MAGWRPAQLFSTKEYTYGIDELSILKNDDGSCTVSFVFGVVFNLFIGDYGIDSRPDFPGLYCPELSTGKDSWEGLTLESWHPAGPETMKTIGPYLTRYAYRCSETPQALYFKTPEFRILDMHKALVVDEPSLCTVEYGEPVTAYDRKTYATVEFTPVNIVLREALNLKWQKATLRLNDAEIDSTAGHRDGYDYFRFELPENSRLDLGYTLTLNREYLDIPRTVFEITID